jgi:hypothetical protein
MIAALGAALFLAPAHVNGFYMSWSETSLDQIGSSYIHGAAALPLPLAGEA